LFLFVNIFKILITHPLPPSSFTYYSHISTYATLCSCWLYSIFSIIKHCFCQYLILNIMLHCLFLFETFVAFCFNICGRFLFPTFAKYCHLYNLLIFYIWFPLDVLKWKSYALLNKLPLSQILPFCYCK
jgi:hypothetical protein